MVGNVRNFTASLYQDALNRYFGPLTRGATRSWPSRIYDLYPVTPNSTLSYLEINSDVCVVCPTRMMAQTLQSTGRVPYLYRYGYNPRNRGLAPHAAEVGMVFGYREHTCLNQTACPRDIFAFSPTLSRKMTATWAAFGLDYDPGFAPYFPLTREGLFGSFLDVDNSGGMEVRRGYNDAKCALWEEMALTEQGHEARKAFCSQSLGSYASSGLPAGGGQGVLAGGELEAP